MQRLFAIAIIVLSTSTAYAEDFKTSAGLYFYTADVNKRAQFTAELAEGAQKFHYQRSNKEVAGELAREELRQGNVCLKQVEQDLRKALKEKEVSKLCKILFKQELNSKDDKAPLFTCMANAEVHEQNGQMEMFLALELDQPAYNTHYSRVLASIGRNHLKETETDLPRKESIVGKVASDWKGLLKSGACSFKSETLDAFLDQHLAQIKEQRSLTSCNRSHRQVNIQLTKLQKRFQHYVPDEWVRATEPTLLSAVLKEVQEKDTFGAVTECRYSRKQVSDQLAKLVKLSTELADKYEIPALDFSTEAGARNIASEFDGSESDWLY